MAKHLLCWGPDFSRIAHNLATESRHEPPQFRPAGCGAGGSWRWDELSEIAVEQPPQLSGLKPGLKLALIEEQARNSFRVVAYRGPKSVVVASDLGIRRAEYLYELISGWAKLDEAAIATANP